jgi:predicted transcriptional regulator
MITQWRGIMACVNPDGSLSESAQKLLTVLAEPLTPEEISGKTGQPLFKVRSSIREMIDAELISETDGRYTTTPQGKELLSGSDNF